MFFINHKKIPIRDSYLKCGAKLLCSLHESEKSLIFSLTYKSIIQQKKNSVFLFILLGM